jgi:hypothetical protein
MGLAEFGIMAPMKYWEIYPAELRAQLRSEVAASQCEVQVFPGMGR